MVMPIYTSNPIHVLTSLFSATENAGDFKLKATTNLSVTGEQIYTTPDTGSWWHQMQDFINLQCTRVVILPLIFYSNQTCLSNNMRISNFWDLYINQPLDVFKFFIHQFENRVSTPRS